MEKTKIDCCPYCKSEKFEYDMRLGRYRCRECNSWFNEDDYLHQLYWENISCLLNGTSIEEPLELKGYFILPSVEEESCGLSDLEKLNIDKVHQIEGEGKMYYHFENTPDEDEYWYDMYDLSTEDLKYLLEELRYEKESEA